jgi:phage terminase large subunit-like protein
MATPSTEALPRFACPDWWEKIQAGETPMASVPLNEKRAAKALAFFNRLRLPDVPGNPPLSEACGDWFRDILVAFLASEDPETKKRLVWEIFCMVPKKNSKTTYIAALGLTALFMEEAPNRQMMIVAPSQKISVRCFGQAQGMIRLDTKLKAIFRVRDHIKSIERRKTGTKLDVLTFGAEIVTGEIPVLTIIDEVHELGKVAGAANVMQQIRGGGITMQGGQVAMITTQSPEQPAGIFRTELDKARKIRDGAAGSKPILLPVIYEYPKHLQKDKAYWRDQRHWSALLPNLNRSIDPERLLADYTENGRANDEAEQIWASQHLNIEIGVGLGSTSWNGAEYWESGAVEALADLDELLRRSEVATFGGDGGGLDDLLGAAVIGREKGTRHWLCWNKAFAHRKVLKLRQEIAPALLSFEREGTLKICDTPAELIKGFGDVFEKVFKSGLLPEKDAVGLDPNNVAAIIEDLSARGMTDEMLRRLLQGKALSPAWWGIEFKLADGTFFHGGTALMNFCVGNAKVERSGNGIIITKQIAGSAKIDPLIATACAAILMSWNPTAAERVDIDQWLRSAVMR